MRKVTHTGNPTEYVLTDFEIFTLLGLAKFSLEHLTDDFENDKNVKLMRREINLVNKLDKQL